MYRHSLALPLLLSLLLAALGQRLAESAAPPVPASSLDPNLIKRMVELAGRGRQAVLAGRYAEALRTELGLFALRHQWQGPRHWQTIDSRYIVERLRRLAALSEQQQQALGESERIYSKARQLQARARYQDAEKAVREVLRIKREVLGEEHPSTAPAYHNLALCLEVQGKYAEALLLAEKALAISRKSLGEDHPRTAEDYRRVASCMGHLGKYALALPRNEKALAICRKVLGEEHPSTAAACNEVGFCLKAQGKDAEALPYFEKALRIYQSALGEDDRFTAVGYNNVGTALLGLGKPGQALPLLEKALAIRRKVQGEEHPDTAEGCNNLAVCLDAQGKYAHALPLLETALRIYRKILSDKHPAVATSYHNLTVCLHSQGKDAPALPLAEKALAIRREALGEDHPLTALSYDTVAVCLDALGKTADALPLAEKALAIRRRMLGEEHPETVFGCNNLAVFLDRQGKFAQAMPLYEKALAVLRKIRGEEHSDTAMGYYNLAGCLDNQGKHDEALPLYKKALAIWRKVHGEKHYQIARSYNALALCCKAQGRDEQALALSENALRLRRKLLGDEHPLTGECYATSGSCLDAQGKNREALPHHEKALAFWRKGLGEEHPRTASGYINVAACLNRLGKTESAIRSFRAALPGYDIGRVSRAASSFDRPLLQPHARAPRECLAVLHARINRTEQAWQYAEENLARGLLEALFSSADPDDNSLRQHVEKLDARLLSLFGTAKLSEDQERLRDELARQRQEALTQLGQRAAARSTALVWPRQRIQKQIPTDTAIVIWVAALGDTWACVLRREGPPRWVKLPGSGPRGVLSANDFRLPGLLHEALSNAGLDPANRDRLLKEATRLWFAPLRKELKAQGDLPDVKHLLVVPPVNLAQVPLELLAPDYTVSYIPSATYFARSSANHRPLSGTSLLALGDPTFQPPTRRPADPPGHGLLVKFVAPGGAVARAGLRSGDVFLQYGSKKLRDLADLRAALTEGDAPLTCWREGTITEVRLPSGSLGVGFDQRPVREAVRAWREATTPVVRSQTYNPLPGTRFEVEALRRLVGADHTTLLLGSRASEQELDRLGPSKRRQYRLIHLATHARIDMGRPEESALVLARDRLPDPIDQHRQGLKCYDGHLRVSTILAEWDLDADLVVLSACETGLGRQTSGDGLLGFTQALLQKGARSVVLSRWKVDDTATALLMVRFYENLLGKRKDLKNPLPRALALAEAKRWLRELSRQDAARLTAELSGGVLDSTTGQRGKVVPLSPAGKKAIKVPEGERPYAHPFYWAAFVLIGDPD
jgi:tetratricopeptide (TPR) repeat protein